MSPPDGTRIEILYLVHDVDDAAVERRLTMFETGGAHVSVAGFRRTGPPLSRAGDRRVIDLGRTAPGAFADRILKVVGRAFRPPQALTRTNADLIVARNLEMLALACRTRRASGKRPEIVYEVLDIHRLMLRRDTVGWILRSIERRLLRHVRLIVISSPAFVREYFSKLQNTATPALLLENKVLGFRLARDPLAVEDIAKTKAQNDGPIRIGWFGILRCRKSLRLLAEFSERMGGRYEIVLRGKPAYNEMPDFDAVVASHEHMRFEGAYRSPDDLERIYGEVDCIWAIDFFEEGLNSAWLLPNRLYEGCLYGRVPIAMAGTQTAEFLREANIGIELDTASGDALVERFAQVSIEERHEAVRRCLRDRPGLFLATRDDCSKLVSFLGEDHQDVDRCRIVERM